jgi:glycosyltransferase involved in cell wall biosynthesis
MRRVFGWHTQIPGCAYYRIQLPLDTLIATPRPAAWSTAYGQKLPLTAKLAADLKAGKATAARDITAMMAERFDVVIGQQVGAGGTGADALWQHMARSGKIMTVLETDDNLMALHGGHLPEARAEMQARADVYRRAVEVSDVVTCTTPALAAELAGWNPHVRVIPNYIDAAMLDLPGGGQHVYRLATDDRWPAVDDVLIGWGGSSTHARDFQLAWPGIARTLVTEPRAYFASMGVMHVSDQFEKLERRGKIAGLRWMDMAKEPWSDYYRRLGWYDIGLAPLEINRFNEAKSWIKILEYCAMGVPFVASAAPEYERFLTGWQNERDMLGQPGPGVLINPGRDHQWGSVLKALVRNDATRQRMSARARIYARKFTIQDHIGEWASALAG